MFFTSFFTFYAQHRQFCIRDEDIFTTVCCKKIQVKNTDFKKSHHKIRFIKKNDFLKKILWYFLFCQKSVSIWYWSRYMFHGCFAIVFEAIIWVKPFSYWHEPRPKTISAVMRRVRDECRALDEKTLTKLVHELPAKMNEIHRLKGKKIPANFDTKKSPFACKCGICSSWCIKLWTRLWLNVFKRCLSTSIQFTRSSCTFIWYLFILFLFM